MRRYPFLVDGSRIVEILLGGYRATTNGESRRERLKEYLLGGRGAQVFAPGYGHVARASATPSSVLEEVTRVVAGAIRVAPARLHAVHFRLARGDKAIIAFEDLARQAESAIAVVSEDPRVTRGRRIEAGILEHLARLPARVSRLVPRHLGEYTVGRYACFIMTMLPGVTLDADSGSLETLQRQAMDFLQALHLETSTAVALDEAGFAQHVDALLTDALQRNPEQSSELRILRGALKESIGGRTLPTVFTHGDFKIENVMYTRTDLRMTGVIDWEHAAERALPLIDPLYLLFYNRTLRGLPWMDALAAIVARPALDADERRCIDQYLQTLGVGAAMFTPLAGIFLIHHIGRRVTLTLDSDAHERLRRIIDDLATRIREETRTVGA